MKKIIALLLLILFSLSVGKGVHYLKGGFSPRRIHSLSQRVREDWNEEVDRALLQTFRYIGRGRQCFAFASDDGNYVLKIPRTDIFKTPFWVRALPVQTYRNRLEKTHRQRQKEVAESFRLSIEELKNETGVLALHFGQSDSRGKKIALIDSLGCSFRLPLEKTPFLLQRQWPLLTKAFLSALKKGERQKAEEILQAWIDVVVARGKKGVLNRDPSFLRNYGYDGKKAYLIDVGTFSLDTSGDALQKSVRDSMHPVKEWLAKIDPQMLAYLNQRLALHVKQKKTICLNMIVKNESPVIRECLKSVKPLIDYWVIVDTGSTDGTQQLIRDFLKEIPGELHERPWVDFSHNRNEALALAKDKADYTFVIDADEELIFSDTFALPRLDKDYYYLIVDTGGCEFMRPALVSNRFDWRWEGVIHELLSSTQAKSYDLLQGITDLALPNRGNRSQDPDKYLKDAKILESELEKAPQNTRYVLHLAQTYVNAKQYKRGIQTYERRAHMGGFAEEVFFSKLQVAKLQEFLEEPASVYRASYESAYAYRPTRIEPLYYLSCHYLREKSYSKAYELLKIAISTPRPLDSVLVEGWIYDWAALYAFIESCYHLGKQEEMHWAMEKILFSKQLPDHLRKETERNLSILNTQTQK